MERLKISGPEPVRKTLENGISIFAKKIITPRPIPGSVAEHEAAHVVAAGEIISASIIPTGDALGTTRPVKMTAVAAAAAAALGYDGTGWDLFLTEYVLGVDPNSAKEAARSVLSGKGEEIEEVATLLQERGTIDQTDVNEAEQNIIDRKEGVFPVEVTINRSGILYSFTTTTFHGEIVFSSDSI
ncbi:hypothetical protein A2Z22_01410 [Candidatus Woesebacteria bacterium RBG_16_34_12]|uniref:Uncharacterized protein n=1 Tax=Candidatus Woesebacteria bacterium RBG_16_34_12 TaxID=1802480 RepID=A0A1F7XA28_9BACT|nr:MAG: hypothetical protein A2Z22_01410 [Candidatus Woesebacteria bacterium RBG_16_34_12]